MLKGTSTICISITALTLGALVAVSFSDICLGNDDPLQDGRWRDNRCDMIPVQMATGSSTAAWQPHDTITGQVFDPAILDIPPGVFALD